MTAERVVLLAATAVVLPFVASVGAWWLVVLVW